MLPLRKLIGNHHPLQHLIAMTLETIDLILDHNVGLL